MNDYLLFGCARHHRGTHGVSARQFHRASAYCESLFHISLGDGYWKMYTIVIQLGAILCLPIYFRARIAEFSARSHGARTAIARL